MSDSNRPSSDNPLLERLSPAQFDASVKFYEADQKLNPQDREQIANDLFSTLTSSTLIGLGSSIVALLIPTIYAKSRNQPIASPPNGATAAALRPRLHKPFLSFMLGLTSLMVVNQQTAKYKFSQQIATLETASDDRQTQVWKAMDYHQAGMFYVYYRKTAEDPSYIIHDPRTFTRQTQHEVHFHPPKKQNANELTGELSHWEQIRRSNGFVSEPTQAEEIHTNDENDTNKPPVDQEPEKPKSAWDAIRGKSGSL